MNIQERHQKEISKLRRFYLFIIIFSNSLVFFIPNKGEVKSSSQLKTIDGHHLIKVSGRSFLDKETARSNKPITILNEDNQIIIARAYLAKAEETHSNKNQLLTILVPTKDLQLLSEHATDNLFIYPYISRKKRKAYEVIF